MLTNIFCCCVRLCSHDIIFVLFLFLVLKTKTKVHRRNHQILGFVLHIFLIQIIYFHFDLFMMDQSINWLIDDSLHVYIYDWLPFFSIIEWLIDFFFLLLKYLITYDYASHHHHLKTSIEIRKFSNKQCLFVFVII